MFTKTIFKSAMLCASLMFPNGASAETLKDPYLPLPKIDVGIGEAWNARFSLEMPIIEPPYIGVNVVDVKPENYEALRVNMVKQSQGVMEGFGSEVILYTVAKYDEIWRVTWVIQHNVAIPQADLPPEAAAMVNALWAEFSELSEGYQWHLSPAPSVAEKLFRE